MAIFRIVSGPGVIRLSGEIDLAAAPQVVAAGAAALAASGKRLRVDLNSVTFLDSTALGALVELHNAATDTGATFTLTNVPVRVHQILDITGLNDIFDIHTVFDIRALDDEATTA